jgi:hypothetical protein
VGPTGRVAVLGRADHLSPGLMTLRLGPPSGAAHFPLEILRNADAERLDDATHALLFAPGPTSQASGEVAAGYQQHLDRLVPRIHADEFTLVREFTVSDPAEVVLQLFARPAP